VVIHVCRVLEDVHASFVETVPFKTIARFTLFQLLYLLVCFGITWIPIAGILFPTPFFLLIPIRQHILPKLFEPEHLSELDAAEYEESEALPHHPRSVILMVCSLWSIFSRALHQSIKLLGFLVYIGGHFL
jgi:hypothetical protein